MGPWETDSPRRVGAGGHLGPERPKRKNKKQDLLGGGGGAGFADTREGRVKSDSLHFNIFSPPPRSAARGEVTCAQGGVSVSSWRPSDYPGTTYCAVLCFFTPS